MKLPCQTKEGCPSMCCGILTPWDIEEWQRFSISHVKVLKKLFAKAVVVSINSNFDAIYVVSRKLAKEFAERLDHNQTRAFEMAIQAKQIARLEVFLCLFLDKNKRCLIYSDRPRICREVGTKEKPCPRMLPF